MQANDITFYQRFEADILSGLKTITIRDKSECHFKAGDVLRVGRFEDNQYFCTIEVLSISSITLDELTEQHAKQENMTLAELKEVIRGIYPSEEQFYLIKFKIIHEDIRMSDSSLNRVSTIIGILGGSLGLIAMVITAYDKVYVEPTQNISQINRNIKDIIGRIKEINKELSELNERILEIEKNKLEQSDLNKTSNELLNLKSVISRLEKGKVDYDVFNQYKPLSKGDVDWIINSIKSLQGTTNSSKQIQYYSKKIDDIQKISYCYVANDFGGYSSNRECVENKSKDLEDANNKLFELQKKLSR